MLKKLCCIGYLLLSLPANANTLKETVAKSLEYSPNLKAVKSALSSSKAQRLGAYLDLLPKANGYYTKSKVHGIDHTIGYNRETTNISKGLAVQTNLFKGGASLASIKLSVLNTKIAVLTLNKTYQDTMLQAATTHVNYILAEESLKLAENEHNVLQKNYESTKLRFDLGELTKTDVAQAQARLAMAESDKAKYSGQVEIVKAQYYNITGMYPTNLTKPEFPNKVMPANVEDAMTIAQNNNKDLLISTLSLKAANENIIIAWSKIMPSIDLIASVNKYYPSSLQNNKLDRSISLQVSVPIFQGGAEYTNVADNYYSKEKAKFNHLQALNNLTTSVRTNWSQLETTKATISSTKAAEAAAKLAYEGVSEEAKIGLKTTLEVLNAEQEFYNNKVEAINANYQTIINAYKLLAVMGKLELDSF